MSIENKIDQYLKDIRELETSLLEVQGKEILPISFFSSSIDILNSLRTGIYEIEAMQLKMMQEHLEENENDWTEENEPVIPAAPTGLKHIEEKRIDENTSVDKPIVEGISLETTLVEKPIPVANVLADAIIRKINTDFLKSLSLNDRFMFQRDLFQGNADEMNKAFSQLNAYQSLGEVLEFLNVKYSIPWNSDSGIALKELLDKRFA